MATESLEDGRCKDLEIRQRIFRRLQEKGLPDWLKTQFRSRLAKELQDSHAKNCDVPPSLSLRRTSLQCNVANALILDHFYSYKYDFSRSIFLSECGNKKRILVKDLLDYLRFPPDSPLYKKLVEVKHCVLTSLLKELSFHFTPATSSHSTGVQTESDALSPLPIAQRLNYIEMEFSSRHSSDVTSVDERLSLHQRRCEEWAKQQVKLEVQRIREVELAQLKLAEQERYQKELSRIQDQLHSDYRQKVDNLNKLERSLLEKLRQKEEELESSVFLQRQVLLKEMDAVRMRESELKRQNNICRQTVKAEEDHVEALLEEVKRRERDISNNQENCDKQVESMRVQFQLESERREQTHLITIKKLESRLDESTEVINSKDDKILQLESELTHWKLECDSLRDSLRSATSVQVDLQKQKDSLQEVLESSEIKTRQQQVKQLEKEVEMLRGRLESMAHQTDQRESDMKATIEELMESISRKEAEIVKLNDRMHKELTRKKARLEQVQSEKDHLQKAVVLLKERLDNLHLVVSEKDIMLADATREAEDLRRQVEVLDRAVKGYLKKDSRPSSRSVHPTFGDERKEGKDSIRSKKVLRFAEPVISNSPHQQRLSTRDHRHLGGSSHWTDVTEDQFAETQAIYERLRQVAKDLEQSYSRMADSDLTQSEVSLLSSATLLTPDENCSMDIFSQEHKPSSLPQRYQSSLLPETHHQSVTPSSDSEQLHLSLGISGIGAVQPLSSHPVWTSQSSSSLHPSSLPPSSFPSSLPPSSIPSSLPPSSLPPSSIPSSLPPSSLPPSSLSPSSQPPSSQPSLILLAQPIQTGPLPISSPGTLSLRPPSVSISEEVKTSQPVAPEDPQIRIVTSSPNTTPHEPILSQDTFAISQPDKSSQTLLTKSTPLIATSLPHVARSSSVSPSLLQIPTPPLGESKPKPLQSGSQTTTPETVSETEQYSEKTTSESSETTKQSVLPPNVTPSSVAAPTHSHLPPVEETLSKIHGSPVTSPISKPPQPLPQPTASSTTPQDSGSVGRTNISLDSLWQGDDPSPTQPQVQDTMNKMAAISEASSDDDWEKVRTSKLEERELKQREPEDDFHQQYSTDPKQNHQDRKVEGESNGEFQGFDGQRPMVDAFDQKVVTVSVISNGDQMVQGDKRSKGEQGDIGDEVDPALKKYMEIIMKERAAKQEQHHLPSKENVRVDEFGIPLPSNNSYSFGDGSVDSPFEDW